MNKRPRTKLSFEVPIPNIPDFEDLQDFHFLLAQLLSSTTYYIYAASACGDRSSILDNGYNELGRPLDAKVLGEWFYTIRPRQVVAPDSPDWSTDQIIEEFTRMCTEIGRRHVMCVVKDPLMADVATSMGAENLAVAYRVRQRYPIPERTWMENMHFLGLLCPEELKEIRPPSCDTSMPIKLALVGKDMDDWRREDYPHIHTHELGEHGKDFFHTRLTDEQIKLARCNILQLKEFIR